MSFTPNNSGLAGQRQRKAPNAPQLTARGEGEKGKRDGPVTDLSSVGSHTMQPADRTLLYTICSLFILISLGMAYSHFHHSPAENEARARAPISAMNLGTISPQLPSWFADKRNPANQYGVKLAWFWTTLFFLPLTFTQPFITRSVILRSAGRWLIATAYWWLVTQYFVHTILLYSGAACISSDPENNSTLDPTYCTFPSKRYVVTTAEDEPIIQPRPHWSGGHDVSGHTFLLTHAILFMVSELALVTRYAARNTIAQAPSPLRSPGTEWAFHRGVRLAVGILCVFWAWMLLMTAVYYHTPPEKFSGFAVGTLGVVLGRWILP